MAVPVAFLIQLTFSPARLAKRDTFPQLIKAVFLGASGT
jgi:hypothetical protein